MVDRVRANSGQGNGRSSKLMCPSDYTPSGSGDFAGFLADLKTGSVYVDVTANNSTGSDAGVDVIGTPLSKASLLTDAMAVRFGGDATYTPNQILGKIADQFYKNAQMLYSGEILGGTSNWTLESDGSYSKEVGISGVNANSNPEWDIYIPDGTLSTTAQDMIDACSLVNKLVTGTNKVTLYCYQACPSSSFYIMLKGAYGSWITS